MRRQVRFHIRTLALILALAFCLSLVPATVLAEDDFAADQTQGDTSTAPDTSVDPGPVESRPAPTQTVDVAVTTDGQGNVNVQVENRPSIDPQDPGKNEQHYAGTGSNVSATPDDTPSGEETTTPEEQVPEEVAPEASASEEGTSPESGEQPTVNVTVNGSVTTTPGETETDEQGRPIHSGATATGSEEIKIETESITTEPSSTETEVVGSDNLGSTGNILANAGNKNDQTLNFTYKGETIEIDKTALINGLKPQAPETNPSEPGKDWTKGENGNWGYTSSNTDKDGNVVTITGSWKVEATQDNNGWVTTETTTETGTANVGAYGYPGGIPLENGEPKVGTTENEDGTTTACQVNADGTITVVTTSADKLTTTTVTYNVGQGSYTKTTTATTTTTIEVTEEKPGQIDITGITVSPGQSNSGNTSTMTLGSLRPTEEVLHLNDRYYERKPGQGNYIKLGTGRYKKVPDGQGDYVYTHKDVKEHLTYPFIDKADPTDVLSYVETALRSSVRINMYDANGNIVDSGHSAIMRLMKDAKGNEVYVYCSQNGKSDGKGPGYDIVTPDSADMGNIQLDKNAMQHIQYIAEKGYWGTQSGAGSLAEVRKLIGNDTLAGELDDGIALAVTQAAIWYYANERGPAMFEYGGKLMDNIFTTHYTNSSGTEGTLSAEEQAAAMALFRALIQRGVDGSNLPTADRTDILSQEKVTGTSIDIKNEAGLQSFKDYVAAQAGANDEQIDKVFTDSDHDFYETDLSLTIAVLPENMASDDMSLIVYANGVKVVEQPIFETNNCVTVKDGQTSIVIPSVILPTDCDIRLNLKGTQQLKTGAYMFRTDVNYNGAQTMIGVVDSVTAQGANTTVDLDVKFNISNVQKPTATVTQTVSTTESTTEDRNWAWDAVWGQDTAYPTPPPVPSNPPIVEPTPPPSEEATPSPKPSDEPSPSPSERPSVTPEPTPEVTPSEQPTPAPTPVVTPEPQPTPNPTPVVTPTPQPTTTPIPTPTPVPTPEPTPVVTPSAPQIPGGGIGDLIPEVPSEWPEASPSHGPANPVDPDDDMEFVPEVTPDLPAASPSMEPDDDMEFVPEVTPDLPAASPSTQPDDDMEFVPEVTPDLPAASPSTQPSCTPDIPVVRPDIPLVRPERPETDDTTNTPMSIQKERAAHRVPKTDDESSIWWVMALTACGCMTLLASRIMRRRKAD